MDNLEKFTKEQFETEVNRFKNFEKEFLRIITECYLNRHDIPGWKQQASFKICQYILLSELTRDGV